MFSKSIVTRALALGVAAFTFTSCDEDTLNSLTQGDTANALKEALGLGVQTAVNKLSEKDGYFSDAAAKIGLPPAAVTAFEAYNAIASTEAGKTIVSAVGLGDNLEQNLVRAFNDAATDAAPKSAKILADEVTGLTIQDAQSILFGAENAATVKLETDTKEDLQAAFHPTITNSMNNVKVANLTATELWKKFADGNNALAKNINKYKNSSNIFESTAYKTAYAALPEQGKSAVDKLDIVDDDISDYVTGRALDGLFLKIAEKEKGIRTNAAERTSDLLKRVFGQLDK